MEASESCAASAQLTTAVPAQFPVELMLVVAPKGPDEVLPLAPVAPMKSAVWTQIEKCTKVLYQVCASHFFFMFRVKRHEIKDEIGQHFGSRLPLCCLHSFGRCTGYEPKQSPEMEPQGRSSSLGETFQVGLKRR